MTYFCPALDPPLDGSGRKTTTLVRDLEYFIHSKFHQNPSSGSGEEVENVNSLTDDRRTTDGRQTDDGQREITIGHWSLWLLCPKNLFSISECSLFEFITCVVYMYVFEHCINDFIFWHSPVCLKILIIHIVRIIDVNTHVKIFTLVLQVSDSLVKYNVACTYISHILQYMYQTYM